MRMRPTLTWEPTGEHFPRTTSLDPVVELVAERGVVVLSGAGLSTESGIPDYRGASGALRRHTPMTYDDFAGSAEARRRYWARSHLGWRTMAGASPNAGHRAVAALRASGHVA
ncbi:MAG: NAD-dependent protein deacetylase 1, partial [Catenulispora sp.]|nr:NAD-dependent protein deacetylase 1 [Catenulispora sp.]